MTKKFKKKYILESSGTIAEEREVLGRPYCCIGAFTEVHNFEHGEGMFGDLLIVRISSHGSDSLRPVDNVVTNLHGLLR
jgi:hypothetical protein